MLMLVFLLLLSRGGINAGFCIVVVSAGGGSSTAAAGGNGAVGVCTDYRGGFCVPDVVRAIEACLPKLIRVFTLSLRAFMTEALLLLSCHLMKYNLEPCC